MKLKNILLTGAAAIALVTSAQAANYSAGDILMGFRLVDFTKSTPPTTMEMVLDLGNYSQFQNATFSSINIKNDLQTLVTGSSTGPASDWTATLANTNIVWSAIGITSANSSGMSSSSNYVFASTDSLAGAWKQKDTWHKPGIYTNIYNFANTTFNTATLDSVNGYVAAPTGNNDWTSVEATGAPFGNFSPNTTFEANSGGGNTLTSVGLNLDKGNCNTNSSTADSVLGTFNIDSSGNLSFVAAVPEPSTYAMMTIGGFALLGMMRRFRKA